VKPATAVLVLALPLGAAEARADAACAGDVGAVLLPVGSAAGALLAKDHKGLAQLAESYASAMAVVYVLVVAGGAIGIATNLLFTHRREHVAVVLDLGRGHAGSSIAIAW
jgi:hypothetical protein